MFTPLSDERARIEHGMISETKAKQPAFSVAAQVVSEAEFRSVSSDLRFKRRNQARPTRGQFWSTCTALTSHDGTKAQKTVT